jgi:hypothetical protein
MDWIRFANDRKGLFFLGIGTLFDWQGGPPFGDGFVYDTPLKNFPPF